MDIESLRGAVERESSVLHVKGPGPVACGLELPPSGRVVEGILVVAAEFHEGSGHVGLVVHVKGHNHVADVVIVVDLVHQTLVILKPLGHVIVQLDLGVRCNTQETTHDIGLEL